MSPPTPGAGFREQVSAQKANAGLLESVCPHSAPKKNTAGSQAVLLPVRPCNQPRAQSPPLPARTPTFKIRQKTLRDGAMVEKTPRIDLGAAPPRSASPRDRVATEGSATTSSAPRVPARCRRPRSSEPETAAPSRSPRGPAPGAAGVAHRPRTPSRAHISRPPAALRSRMAPSVVARCAPRAFGDFRRRCRLRDVAPPDGSCPSAAPLGCSFGVHGAKGASRGRAAVRSPPVGCPGLTCPSPPRLCAGVPLPAVRGSSGSGPAALGGLGLQALILSPGPALLRPAASGAPALLAPPPHRPGWAGDESRPRPAPAPGTGPRAVPAERSAPGPASPEASEVWERALLRPRHSETRPAVSQRDPSRSPLMLTAVPGLPRAPASAPGTHAAGEGGRSAGGSGVQLGKVFPKPWWRFEHQDAPDWKILCPLHHDVEEWAPGHQARPRTLWHGMAEVSPLASPAG